MAQTDKTFLLSHAGMSDGTQLKLNAFLFLLDDKVGGTQNKKVVLLSQVLSVNYIWLNLSINLYMVELILEN
jgi:hypothetical protein